MFWEWKYNVLTTVSKLFVCGILSELGYLLRQYKEFYCIKNGLSSTKLNPAPSLFSLVVHRQPTPQLHAAPVPSPPAHLPQPSSPSRPPAPRPARVRQLPIPATAQHRPQRATAKASQLRQLPRKNRVPALRADRNDECGGGDWVCGVGLDHTAGPCGWALLFVRGDL